MYYASNIIIPETQSLHSWVLP